MSGTPEQIGPYRIDRELGRGGMGVVYLGHDPRLDRSVAIKALPEHLAQDPDRLARFEREARTLAQLSHPNVAGIHGVEEHAGARYLVLEYVEGETLAERLDRGGMPVDEALEIASQIAAGVEAAHEAGVIHRDLKPGNIMITPDGKAKVLDFGLARTEEGASSSGSSMSPTLTSPAGSPTVEGVILGTAAYMSPEQARGRRVDRRADIWSFGVILYEMLTGASPFIGETVSDSIGAILHKEVNLDRLPPGTPPAVRHVLRRCLQRDRQMRYRDIGDARLDLQMREPAVEAAPESRRPGALMTLLIALAMVAVGAGAWIAGGAMRAPAAPVEPLHLAIPQRVAENPGGRTSSEFAVAYPTGQVVFIAEDGSDGGRSIYVRGLDEAEPRRLPGTDDASDVTVSPDGQIVLFIWNDPDSTKEELRRVSIDGGPVTTVLATDTGPGFRLDDAPLWLSQRSVLVLGGNQLRLHELSLETLQTTLLLNVAEVVEGAAFALPWSVLPGRRIALVSMGVNDPDRGPVWQTAAIDLDERTAKQVTGEAFRATVFDEGRRIAFLRDDALFVAGFDQASLSIIGELTPVLAPVIGFDVSPDGDLYYKLGAGRGEGSRPMLVGLDGAREPLMERRLILESFVHLSPDGGQVGLTTQPEPGGPPAAQILDIDTGFLSPIVTDNLVTGMPVWMNDDEVSFLLYLSAERNELQRIRLGAESVGSPILPESARGGVTTVADFSPDGRWMAYQSSRGYESPVRSIWLAPLDGAGDPRPIVQSGRVDTLPAFSPNGAWLAYCSDSAGEYRVVMQAFDTESGTLAPRVIPVSQGQGTNPVWSPDGEFLYFIDPVERNLRRVAVEDDPSLRVSRPEVVLPTTQLEGLYLTSPRSYDIFPDGERFVFIEDPPDGDLDLPYINVTLHWFEELRRTMPLE